MKLEHVALNVAAPNEMAEWYIKNLGMVMVRQTGVAPWIQFIGDGSGKIAIELYSNPDAPVPNYAEMDPLVLHLAFVSDDPDADKERLMAAGATFAEDRSLPDGTRLLMLRDPWGLCIQFCKRTKLLLQS